jgi:hypothetical protein
MGVGVGVVVARTGVPCFAIRKLCPHKVPSSFSTRHCISATLQSLNWGSPCAWVCLSPLPKVSCFCPGEGLSHRQSSDGPSPCLKSRQRWVFCNGLLSLLFMLL